jgi:hypothetical protein
MADALQLLESNRVAVGQAFGQIFDTMESLNRTGIQAAQFKAETTKMQFDMAEQARRTDADIASTVFRNNLAASAHQAEMALMPLKFETEKLRLESSKVQHERALKTAQQQEFNTIAGPWKDIAASTFAKNQNPEYAKGYLQVESAWRAKIAAGEKFDPAAFSRDISYLNSEYGQVDDASGYNPEVTHLLRAMGAPNEAARYETKNPVFSGNLAGLKASAILGGPQGFQNVAGKYGHLFDEKEMANLAIAADSYGSFDSVLEGLDKSRRMTFAQLNQYPDGDPRRDTLLQQLEGISSEINSIRSQRDQVFRSVVTGDGIVPASKIEPVDPMDALMQQALSEYNNRKTGAASSVPEESGPEDNPEDRALIDKGAFGLPRVQSRFPQAMQGISMKPMRGASLADNPEGVRQIRKQIIRNLDDVEDIRALFNDAIKPGKDGKPSKFRQVFEQIGEDDVSLDEPFRTDEYEVSGTSRNFDGSMEFGKMNTMERIGDLGGVVSSITGRNNIQNVEELQRILKDFKGTPAQERLLLQDLYANMVLTDLVNSFR